MTLVNRSEPPAAAVRQRFHSDTLSDEQLVAAIAAGDQTALRVAYDQCAPSVFGVAIGLLRDRSHAEDVTQEVFLRLWDRPDRFQPDRGSLRSFLQMDAHGRSIDLLRSARAAQRRDRVDHDVRKSTIPAGTEELAMSEIASGQVRDALFELPDEQRIPITLAFFDGYSYRDVADLLSLPEGTIKSRIRAGMQRLRLAFEPEMAR